MGREPADEVGSRGDAQLLEDAAQVVRRCVGSGTAGPPPPCWSHPRVRQRDLPLAGDQIRSPAVRFRGRPGPLSSREPVQCGGCLGPLPGGEIELGQAPQGRASRRAPVRGLPPCRRRGARTARRSRRHPRAWQPASTTSLMPLPTPGKIRAGHDVARPGRPGCRGSSGLASQVKQLDGAMCYA